MSATLLGKSILEKHGESDANRAVLHELRSRSALVHHEHYHHSYPHCWRSKTPVIFRAMDQWFIKVDHLLPAPGTRGGAGTNATATGEAASDAPPPRTFREQALAAIAVVEWIPAWGRPRIEAAVKGRPDWCISRQRAWGVPLPAFYAADGQAILDARIVRRVAELVAEHGSNIWFERTPAELWALCRPADWSGPEAARKSPDTLDVWIDSGSSARCVTASRPELRGNPLPFQADLYLEGSDQHRGWFQSSLLLSLAGNGAPPFRQVLTHGFVVDAEREKISKSKQAPGAYVKPQSAEAYIKQWGADVVRLWVASQDFSTDTVVSEDRLAKVAETYRLLRNTLRYQLANLYDFEPGRDAVPADQLTGLDRWVLAEFARMESEVVRAYEAYDFHLVYQRVSQFAAVGLSALYHDVVKDRLYTDPPDSPRRRSTQTTLHRLVRGLCCLLSPLVPFTADEAWQFIPHTEVPSVLLAEWEPAQVTGAGLEPDTWAMLVGLRGRALAELEAARQSKRIGKALEAKIVLEGTPAALDPFRPHAEALRELLNVSALAFAPFEGSPPTETPAVTVKLTAALPRIRVERAEGRKCERCWHWETDVGADTNHPTLCARCVAAVSRGSRPA
jgi:isoleucyl-tRNA synthetase